MFQKERVRGGPWIHAERVQSWIRMIKTLEIWGEGWEASAARLGSGKLGEFCDEFCERDHIWNNGL